MGLKILHSADWHLDSPFASFPEPERQFLRQEQKKIPGRIAELCRREKCDLVLLAGDIFDGTPTGDTVRSVKRALEECAVPVLIAPGNHDYLAPGSPWQEKWPENVYIFRQPGAVVLEDLNCRVYGAGYDSMDCPPLLEGFHAEGEEQYAVMVLHGDPLVRNSPCCPISASQVRESGLQYLALGHIHKAGSFHAGDTLCGWPGCPMGRGWEETGEKGVYLATLGKQVELRRESLGLPRFWEETVEVSGNVRRALENRLPAAATEDFYRITLTGFADGDAENPEQHFSYLPRLVLRDERERLSDLWADVGEDSLRGMYFRLLCQQAEKDPRAVLAARISRKLLQGREVTLP